MEAGSLDQSHGRRLEAQVQSLFGSTVSPRVPDDSSNFWLLAAFSRSRLKLSAQSVGDILQSILGGQASCFAVVEVEENIFKFSIFSKSVGLFIYNPKIFLLS